MRMMLTYLGLVGLYGSEYAFEGKEANCWSTWLEERLLTAKREHHAAAEATPPCPLYLHKCAVGLKEGPARRRKRADVGLEDVGVGHWLKAYDKMASESYC